MKITTLSLCAALAAVPAMADPQLFRSIAQDAAGIERNAAGIHRDLKSKRFDAGKVKQDIEQLGAEIARLKQNVETFDSNSTGIAPHHLADWELVKQKVQLLAIFQERKEELSVDDLGKHRALIRAHAGGIAKRARMLQQTAGRLDR